MVHMITEGRLPLRFTSKSLASWFVKFGSNSQHLDPQSVASSRTAPELGIGACLLLWLSLPWECFPTLTSLTSITGSIYMMRAATDRHLSPRSWMPLATVSLSPRRCCLRSPIPHPFPAVQGAGAALHPSTAQMVPCSLHSTTQPFWGHHAVFYTVTKLELIVHILEGLPLRACLDHTRGQCL